MKYVSVTEGMTYTTREVNANWKIKVNGVMNGKKMNILVGVSGLVNMIGKELADKFIVRAFRDMLDKCICKLRRGLKVTFYAF